MTPEVNTVSRTHTHSVDVRGRSEVKGKGGKLSKSEWKESKRNDKGRGERETKGRETCGSGSHVSKNSKVMNNV